ncbi:transcriptional repressor [Flavobacteriaceae bacterium S356]|uniref:Transcriptional repressor n=1 Tax=Asprobacillus argus TaxID=3076534 RepID=A0ABU3LC87_9FLAO|nr:transcriptional repressor [Flavobacteriaceae bacterium S356]
MGIIRKTKSVGLLLNVFNQSKSALSVVHLIENLKASMNKTTVYRILDRLEQEGVVHSFLDKDGLTWYAKCTECTSHEHSDVHPHFQCNDCGTIECLSIDISIPTISDRQIDSADVLLQGTCPSCLS